MSEPTTLIDAYLDGDLSLEASNQLEAWLLEDESHRQILVDRVIEAMLLRDTIVSAEAPHDTVTGEPVIVESEASVVIIDVKSASLSRQNKRFDSIHWQRHKIRFSTFSALMTLLVCSSFGYVMWLTITPDVSRPNGTGEDYNFVARITGQYEHRWAESARGIPWHAFLAPGERLELLEGLIEITYYNGAVVILQGPAMFVVNSSGAGALEVGKLTGLVRPNCTGLTIEGPSSRVVDLGTKFAMLVDDSGHTEVHVLEGSVRFEGLNREGKVKVSQVMRHGQSVRFDSERFVVEAIRSRPTDFVQNFPAESGSWYAHHGATISINHRGDNSAGDLASTDVAGVVPASNWNNVGDGVDTPDYIESLTLNDGTSSGATATLTSTAGFWHDNTYTVTSADLKMLQGNAHFKGDDNALFTVTNLPSSFTAGGYSVYVYTDHVNSARAAEYTLTEIGGGGSVTTITYVTTSGGFNDGTNDGDGNYGVFSGLTGSSFTISLGNETSVNTSRVPYDGFQIVGVDVPDPPVPEPPPDTWKEDANES